MRNSKKSGAKISRRDLLKRAVLAGTGAALAGCVSSRNRSRLAQNENLVHRENQLPGTRSWLLENTRIDPRARYRCPWIEGFVSATSARAGQTIDFFVSTNPAANFTIDLYRMGFYAGDGGRLMRHLGPFTGHTQPDPEIGRNRLRECRW